MDKNTPAQATDGIKPDVLDYDDIIKMAPFLKGHHKIINAIMRLTGLDGVNRIHRTYCDTPGVEFAHRMVRDEFKFKMRIDNIEVLDRFKEGPFITVSNHPFGSYDGILLIDMVGSYRPDYKVMVNLILNHITAMRQNFIAVDPLKSDDPEKKKITMQGIREAMKHVKEGHPLGFFPAGAIAKLDNRLHVTDLPWQPTIIRLIKQLQVPVIPIFFHGHLSTSFNILGRLCWQLRTLRLAPELYKKYGTEVHVTFGQPISVERQNEHKSLEDLGNFLRHETLKLEKVK